LKAITPPPLPDRGGNGAGVSVGVDVSVGREVAVSVGEAVFEGVGAGVSVAGLDVVRGRAAVAGGLVASGLQEQTRMIRVNRIVERTDRLNIGLSCCDKQAMPCRMISC